MGKCISHVLNSFYKRCKITVLMIGLDNAGKTCTTRSLLGESVDEIVPTVGFSSAVVRHGKFDVTVYDLGGGKSIRGIWKNYYAEAHGIIFVIDASAVTRINECKDAIMNLLNNPAISGKPLLLLANKQDIECALDEVELCEILDLENLVNNKKTPTRIETCSAVCDRQKSKYKPIKIGFNWLLKTVEVNWESLATRVERDVRLQKETEEKLRVERMERVKKIREERENEIGDNRENDGIDATTDPFKPVSQIREEIAMNEKRTAEDRIAFGANNDDCNENLDFKVTKPDQNSITTYDEAATIKAENSSLGRRSSIESRDTSSRINSPESRLIRVTPKHSAKSRSESTRSPTSNTMWTPYVNSEKINEMNSSLVSVQTPECKNDTTKTTVIAHIERQDSDLMPVGTSSNLTDLPAINGNLESTTSLDKASSSQDELNVAQTKKRKKKRNQFKRSNKIMPRQTSTEDSCTMETTLSSDASKYARSLPPLKLNGKISSPAQTMCRPSLMSMDITKLSSDSVENRIQWNLAEDLNPFTDENQRENVSKPSENYG